MRFAGHCWRAKQEITSDLLLWSPNYGKRRVGRPAITYIDQLCRDTGYLPNDLPTLLQDRDGWSDILMNARATSTWWWLRIQAWLKRCVIQQIRHYLYHFDSRAFVGRKLYFLYFSLLSPDNHANTRVFAIAAGDKYRLDSFPPMKCNAVWAVLLAISNPVLFCAWLAELKAWALC